MKLCSDKEFDCFPICDFCKHYDFDKCHCNKHDKTMDPDDGCDDFYCSWVDKSFGVRELLDSFNQTN